MGYGAPIQDRIEKGGVVRPTKTQVGRARERNTLPTPRVGVRVTPKPPPIVPRTPQPLTSSYRTAFSPERSPSSPPPARLEGRAWPEFKHHNGHLMRVEDARPAGRAPRTKPAVRYPKSFEQFELCGRSSKTGKLVEMQFAPAANQVTTRNAEWDRVESTTFTGEAFHSHQAEMTFEHAGKDTASHQSVVGQADEDELPMTFVHAGEMQRGNMGSDMVPLEGCSF